MKSWRCAIGLTSFALLLSQAPWSIPSGGVAGTAPPAARWADWVEPDFPFFSSVLDARRAGAGLPENNLTPRGLMLNLGRGYWVGLRHRPAARRRGVARQRRHAEGAGAWLVSRPRPQDAGRPVPRAGARRKSLARQRHLSGWQAGARRRSTTRASRRRAPRKSAAVRCRKRWGVSTPFAWSRRRRARIHRRRREVREWMTLSANEQPAAIERISTSAVDRVRCGSCSASRRRRRRWR